jgi:hypothetical protein
MSEWLDTQTQAILQGNDPPKFAPSVAADFSLVLLDRGLCLERHQKALTKFFPPEKHVSIPGLLERACPLVIVSSISYGDAMLGQFELICADSISVVLRDEVASEGEPDYLENLFQMLRKSQEFETISVTLLKIPQNDHGNNFCDQFLGGVNVLPPISFTTTQKKARIMRHWAEKIGVEMEMNING